MADFGPSGLEHLGLPGLTRESLERGGDPRVLGWLREAVVEGDRINRSDPQYDRIEQGMAYVSGQQRGLYDAADAQPRYIPRIMVNESRRVVQAHTSALTDLRPVFAYKPTDIAFSRQADQLNKLTIAWWMRAFADIELGYCIKYGLAGGTGDLVTEWDPYAGEFGDAKIHARDCRDTLPIRPPTAGSRSIQDWQGLILREAHTVNAMAGLFPDRQHLFRPTTDSLLSTLMGRFKYAAGRMISPAGDALSGLNTPPAATRLRSGEVILYRMWLTDRTVNLTGKPIPMGTPGAGWSYLVPPGGRVYPFKRMVVATPDAILYDGPSTYWHGMFPVSRLKLWDLPWLFLGTGLLNDLAPLQDSINQSAQDIFLGLKKWLDPSVAYNRGAVSESFMRTFDPRRPGAKIKLALEGLREGFKVIEGPPAQVLALALQVFDRFLQKFDDLSGTPNLQELLALRQLPGAETIEKYWEALTPELRQEGRMMEAFLRDVGDQLKGIRFQYETNAHRVQVLGQQGADVIEDFDYDPAVMVPGLAEGDAGYEPGLDYRLPRDQRAQAMSRKITFTISPNSLLAMNATEQKLMRLQLFRAGAYDIWSLAEILDIPNYGAPPAIPLPPVKPLGPEALQEIAALAMQPGGAQAIGSKYTLDPMTGQLLEIRIPQTVPERLIAQQMLGIGLTENPAGRKASGQAPPRMEQKSDGRSTVTESRHDKGPGSE